MTTGSRGDVQPFIALGAGLLARGHEVRLACPGDLGPLVKEAGIEFFELPGNVSDFFSHPAVVDALRKGGSALQFSRALRKLPKPPPGTETDLFRAMRDAGDQADVVVNQSGLAHGAALTGPPIRWATTSWKPITPTGERPAIGLPRLPLGPLYNRATYAISNQIEWALVRPSVNRVRKSSGLPEFGFRSPLRDLGRTIPVIYPFSPEVLAPSPDWPTNTHVTGFWYWNRAKQPSPELRAFIDAGPAPVVVAMGSNWSVYRAGDLHQLVIDAVRRAGRRVVLVDGPERDLPADAVRVHDVDYQWLLPRSAAVIHHAGLGHTADVLRAGVPHVTVPVYGDQPFWSATVSALGVGSPPVPFSELSGDRLTAALRQALDDNGMRDRAAALGDRIRGEQGVENACDVIERWAAKP
ncbi:UDP:flavonoid glycosyltransferase YjiC, YdhE family [Goodfellowiella coeruleoviolacea]|uniref:UDP:flavonoid glycosyltransferase YjiC, YdhE family n=1 Tax=Goodfellowiella coeruleoviolacea TaxID=334858 RepID=A0AAE3GMF2_9PSEU|nr:UDP:flavonoid glycosyltransferase YjiC, YdhE family [Goodfellowiella coeruleoviolacea]